MTYRLSDVAPNAVAAILAAVAAEAGLLLASVPDRTGGQRVKPDGSPATDADLASEALILRRLAEQFPGITCVAEESADASVIGDAPFFLIDPLDGTRDYVAGGDCSVNIALVVGTRPVAAALAGPGDGRVWMAGEGAFVRNLREPEAWRPARVRPAPVAGLTALMSRRHGDRETEECLTALPVAERRAVSSALKFGLVASGEADLYVRCGPTMEWDTAAGDLIVQQAGGRVVGLDGGPLAYRRVGHGLRNGPFAAMGDPGLAATVRLVETSQARP